MIDNRRCAPCTNIQNPPLRKRNNNQKMFAFAFSLSVRLCAHTMIVRSPSLSIFAWCGNLIRAAWWLWNHYEIFRMWLFCWVNVCVLFWYSFWFESHENLVSNAILICFYAMDQLGHAPKNGFTVKSFVGAIVDIFLTPETLNYFDKLVWRHHQHQHYQ